MKEAAMRRRFFTLDVFTNRRFAGNPLAVVLEPQGLETAAMQTIAREFGHPETVFVLPPADPTHRARLRIFTPGRELPFAGHPTVGTAVLLASLDGGAERRALVLEETVGPVRCQVAPSAGGGVARFGLPRLPAQVGAAAAQAGLAGGLGLAPDDIGFAGFVPAVWSAGNAFTFVPLRGRAHVARSRPDTGRWDAAFGNAGAFLFCGEPVAAQNAFHGRMYGQGMGIYEDPATGSAGAAPARP